MTAILCYGDSNTWGYEASTQGRLGRWDRWPGVLQRELGDDVHVIEEGQNGRTTVFDVPFEPYRNGLAYLPVALQTHAPLDAVVVDLGTNDLFLPGVNAYHVAHGAMKLESSPVDGIHFEADGHRAIGVAVAGRLRELLGL